MYLGLSESPLAPYRIEDAVERRLETAARLPARLRSLVWLLLGYDESAGVSAIRGQEPKRQLQARAAVNLDHLPAALRLAVFETLLPTLAPYVEASWQAGRTSPYPFGWMRPAFRAPNRPDVTLSRRADWLLSLLGLAGPYYTQDVLWFACWASDLEREIYGAPTLGWLLAAVIDRGGRPGQEVFEILAAGLRGEHETLKVCRSVLAGLLAASRPEGWELVEQLLLAAERQEGLRQVILETADEGRPEAFRRMVHLVNEQRMTRFSSVVRAVGVWAGLGWEAADAAEVRRTLSRLDCLLNDEAACGAALTGENAEDMYLALCVLGFGDVERAVQPAALALAREPEHRFAAAYFLGQLRVPEALTLLLPRLHDDDLRVSAVAFAGLTAQEGTYPWRDPSKFPPGLFEELEKALERFPATARKLESPVWPWFTVTADRRAVADALVAACGEGPMTRLLPYLDLMSVHRRAEVAAKLGKLGPEEAIPMLLRLLGDRSVQVREAALKGLAGLELAEAAATEIEAYLTRGAEDLRRGVLQLLLKQADQRALSSARRLLQSANPNQRLAGLELLRRLREEQRSVAECVALAETHATGALAGREQKQAAIVSDQKRKAPTLKDGLGLFDPAERTRPVAPRPQREELAETPLVTPAAVACVNSLDKLMHEHRDKTVAIEFGNTTREQLLGNSDWFFFPRPDPTQPLDRDVLRLPLREVWEKWAAERPAELRDRDGLELIRALATIGAALYGLGPQKHPEWLKDAMFELYGHTEKVLLDYPHLVEDLLEWLLRMNPAAGAADFLLRAVEHSLSLLRLSDEDEDNIRTQERLLVWLGVLCTHGQMCPECWEASHHARLWPLLRWLDEPAPGLPRHRPHLEEAMLAYEAGAATEADLLDQLIGERSRPGERYPWLAAGFEDLKGLSGRRPEPRYGAWGAYPALVALVDKCRRRIIEVELERGDLPTAASEPALSLRHTGGMDVLFRLLQAFGKGKFERGWLSLSQSRSAVFSHLVRTTFPAQGDTPERFAAGAKDYGISRKRLIETAVYAPQWAAHVEQAIGWPDFAEAVWWFYAHTKDERWHVEREVREVWTAQVSERTPLGGQELIDGAVDVAWFGRVYPSLEQENRWAELAEAAKYASGGGGHTRALLFAEAMVGRVDPEDLRRHIADKPPGLVRALGLVPLPEGPERAEVVLQRYRVIQEFARGSRQFGSQRQASEKLAARIGLRNLARTAGYPDPLRLEWAMELRSVADLAAGPISVTSDGVSVSLAISALGEPELTVEKDGRALREVPAKLRKQEEVAALTARRRDIKQQAAAMRVSLEQAMCRGDVFRLGELRELMGHPVLRPMLSDLVFVADGLLGYPSPDGSGLAGLDGAVTSVAPEANLRLAHPCDLLEAGNWHLWQQECFRSERIQPFKQLFRELYLLTAAERAEGNASRRYAGHQVNPRQALALLGRRGWVANPEEGVLRTFHDEEVTAWVTFLDGWLTPAEVEGPDHRGRLVRAPRGVSVPATGAGAPAGIQRGHARRRPRRERGPPGGRGPGGHRLHGGDAGHPGPGDLCPAGPG